MVSDTAAESMGESSPAARCRKRLAAARSRNVMPAWPRSRPAARKAATSRLAAGRAGAPYRSHQVHQACNRRAVGGAGVVGFGTAAIGAGGSVRRGQVAEFEILAEPVEALVPAEPLELGGMGARLHAGAEGAAFQAVAAELMPSEPRCGGAALDDARDGARRQRAFADRRLGGGASGAAWAGSQRRRSTGPSVIAAASSQRASARTGQSSVLPWGRGDQHRIGLRPLGALQGKLVALVGAFELGRAGRRRAPSGAARRQGRPGGAGG
jgi:hypothetical protein